jgi:hypothetical protein
MPEVAPGMKTVEFVMSMTTTMLHGQGGSQSAVIGGSAIPGTAAGTGR